MLAIGRPDSIEYGPHARQYVDLVPDGDLGAQLETQLTAWRTLLAGLDDAWAGTYAYAPGKWTIKEVVGHVIDTERICAYRLLALARGEAAALPGYDQEVYVRLGRFNERNLAQFTDELASVRSATLSLLRGVPADGWLRRGVANSQPFSARGVAYVLAGHDLHHAQVMRERYRLSPGASA